MTLKAQRIRASLVAETWVFYECQESFLWRILWLLSANVYGLTDVFNSRSNRRDIRGRDSMGYGQIVPLVLLILPVFAAMQSVYGLFFSSIRTRLIMDRLPGPCQTIEKARKPCGTLTCRNTRKRSGYHGVRRRIQ